MKFFWDHHKSKLLGLWHTLELLFVGAMVLWINSYFFSDPTKVVLGYDYLKNIEEYNLWHNFWHCGSCVFWNGLKNSGSPALADFVYGLFNPLFVFPAAIWGARLGGMISMGMGFLLASSAQWWISKTLGQGVFSRVGFAILAGIGGHIVGPLLNDWVLIQVSVGVAYLVVASLIAVIVDKKLSGILMLSISSSLLLLSGSGYMLIAVFSATFPALLFLIIRYNNYSLLWNLCKSGLLMVAGTLLILYNQMFFMGGVVKHSVMQLPNIGSINMFALLINQDFALFEKLMNLYRGLPGGYFHFVGGLTILFALIALVKPKKSTHVPILFVVLSMFINFYLSNGELFNFLSKKVPMLVGFTNFPLFFNFGVICLVILASEGFDFLASKLIRLMKKLVTNWRHLFAVWQGLFGVVALLIIIVLLTASLIKTKTVTERFNGNEAVSPRFYNASNILQKNKIKPETAGWVQVPSSAYAISLTLEKGYKLLVDPNQVATNDPTVKTMPSYVVWDKLEVGRNLPYVVSAEDQLIDENESVALYKTKHNYAYVTSAQGEVPCKAQSTMGKITVNCPAVEGVLNVAENNYANWKARSGKDQLLIDPKAKNLQIAVSAKNSQISLSYHPPHFWRIIFIQLFCFVLFLLIIKYEKKLFRKFF